MASRGPLPHRTRAEGVEVIATPPARRRRDVSTSAPPLQREGPGRRQHTEAAPGAPGAVAAKASRAAATRRRAPPRNKFETAFESCFASTTGVMPSSVSVLVPRTRSLPVALSSKVMRPAKASAARTARSARFCLPGNHHWMDLAALSSVGAREPLPLAEDTSAADLAALAAAMAASTAKPGRKDEAALTAASTEMVAGVLCDSMGAGLRVTGASCNE